jgi:spermidine/putrescine transport system ATP-binding protein
MSDFAIELRNIGKSFGAHTAVREVSLTVRRNEFFSLVGPSGCGKTTCLRMIAGFDHPDAGEILLEGRVANGTPVAMRDVNLVFQNYALFPHMSVSDNVAFGLRMQKTPPDQVSTRVAQALRLVRMDGLGARFPKELSGGQQQRVALARALVTQPSVVLLDEPLGALDLKLRKEMQLELKKIQRELGMTFLYVTHDQEEALVLSDRIAVMDHGRILQVGSPAEVYERPVNRFVAEFIGDMNVLECRVVQADGARVVASVNGVSVNAHHNGSGPAWWRAGAAVILAVRPEKILLGKKSTQGFANCCEGRIEETVYLGADTQYAVRVNDALLLKVRRHDSPVDAFRCGDLVYVGWSAESTVILRADGHSER